MTDTPSPQGSEWRQPGVILLVACYELGHQPLGIALPQAFLERAGYRPATLDLQVEALDPGRLERARLMAISVPMHTALRLGRRLAEAVRQRFPDIHICMFGHYAWLNAAELCAGPVDTVLSGEAEGTLVSLTEALEAGDELPEGVWRPDHPAPPRLDRLDFPVPSRSTLPPVERYAHLAIAGEERPAGYVEASRGCLHLCRHCPIPPVYEGRFFVLPREVVLEDIARQVEAGARHITFGDPDFLNGPGHSRRIVRALHERFPEVTWDFTAKVEHLLRHRNLLPDFVEQGCVFAISAVESLSDEVLERLDKGHTRAEALELFEVAREAGLNLRPTWVAFTPWTTLEDYLELFEAAVEHHLVGSMDPVQLTVRLLIPPGSLLLEEPSLQPHLGELDRDAYTYQWDHPDPRMDELHRQVMAAMEVAAAAERSPQAIFQELRALAWRMAGREKPAGLVAIPETPRLTEAWFC